jgi:hypothetical protein
LSAATTRSQLKTHLEAAADGIAPCTAPTTSLGAEHDVARDALDVVAGLGDGRLAARLIAELLEVIAGAESAAGAGEDDDPRVGIRLGLDERLVQVRQQRGSDRVEPFGAIQRDDTDGAVVVQHGVAHRWVLSRSQVFNDGSMKHSWPGAATLQHLSTLHRRFKTRQRLADIAGPILNGGMHASTNAPGRARATRLAPD